MKEIIPLKKDIVFNTKIGEITDINLEHDYKVKDDLIEGNVSLSGSYKMTEASVIEEEFFYKIPFGVAIPNNVNRDTINIEIDDFKYEINKDTLNVNIDLELRCEENEEIINSINEDIVFDEDIDNKVEIKEEKNDIVYNEEINNITNNIIDSDNKYITYKVYIVRSGDTIESICKKYNVTIDDIKDYNDITNINVSDKIIIPQINE